MNENEIYNEIYRKVSNIQNNIYNAKNNLVSFSKRANESLKIDDESLYKTKILDISDELDIKYQKIKSEIIPELESKL